MEDANNQPQRSGPSGGCAFTAAICGVALILFCESLAKARDLSGGGSDAAARGIWAMGMTVVLGLAITSIRRGPVRGREAGYLTAVMCLSGIGWASFSLIRFLLR